MRIFSKLYNWMVTCSRHRHAPYYLYGLSFAESSVFPIPPDVMLAPMALANPHRAWRYAIFTTIASVLGGILGYFIGMFFFSLIHPYIIQLGYDPTYQKVEHWFKIWGFWIIFVAGWGPIPYKLFTIAAGTLGMPFLPFVLGSTVGRGGRFFLVTALMLLGGERMDRWIKCYIDSLGWIVLILLVIVGGYSYLGS